jgi:YD repeat-containing protein
LSPSSTAGILAETYYDALGVPRESCADVKAGLKTALVFMDEPLVVEKMDPESYETVLTYDIHGRLIQTQHGKGEDVLPVTASYQYDPLRLVIYADANANTYRYSYDGAGRLRSSESDDTGRHVFEYDGLQKTRQSDASGGWAEWTYSGGRVVTNRVSDPLDGVHLYSWKYDTAWFGAVASQTDPLGINTFGYDEFGRLKSDQRTYLDKSGAVVRTPVHKCAYDLQGRILKTTLPSGETLGYKYSYGYLTSKQKPKTSTTLKPTSINYTYDNYGHPTNWASATGIKAAVSYSTTPLWASALKFSAGSRTWERKYTYADNGLVKTFDEGGGIKRKYTYDSLKRLTQVERGPAMSLSLTESFTYDDNGNLLTLEDPDGNEWSYGTVY